MFISSEYDCDEINKTFNNSFIKELDKEIKNESTDIIDKQFICYSCLEKERNIFLRTVIILQYVKIAQLIWQNN